MSKSVGQADRTTTWHDSSIEDDDEGEIIEDTLALIYRYFRWQESVRSINRAEFFPS